MSFACSVSSICRRQSSVAARKSAYLSGPIPACWLSSSKSLSNSWLRLPNSVSSSRASSSAVLPLTPQRKQMASNSASDRFSAPLDINRSLGLSIFGQSDIATEPPCYLAFTLPVDLQFKSNISIIVGYGEKA
jgi:hypothetical protein